MSAGGSRNLVLIALAANFAIAIAKFVAAAWTRSSAMLAEAIHSLVDTSSQALLLYGLNRARRPADASHPFGYSREIYFWSFVVAVLLFSMGAGVSIYEGIEKLRDPHPISDFWVNYTVLGIALALEGFSAYRAFVALDSDRGPRGWLASLRASKDAALFTVLLEEVAAISGLLIALFALLCVQFLGWEQADAIAAILIGMLLATVAACMSVELRSLIVGEAVSPEVRAGIASPDQATPTRRKGRSSAKPQASEGATAPSRKAKKRSKKQKAAAVPKVAELPQAAPTASPETSVSRPAADAPAEADVDPTRPQQDGEAS